MQFLGSTLTLLSFLLPVESTPFQVPEDAARSVNKPNHCEDIGWIGNTTKAFDDCDVFEDKLTIHLTSFVGKPDCVETWSVRVGPEETTTYSFKEIVIDPIDNQVSDKCSKEEVTVRVHVKRNKNMDEYISNSWLDFSGCLNKESDISFAETNGSNNVRIKLLDNIKLAQCVNIQLYDSSMLKLENTIHANTSGLCLVADAFVDRCKDNIVTVEVSSKNDKTRTKLKVPKKTKDCKSPNMSMIVGLSVGGLIGIVVMTILIVLYKSKRKPNTVMKEDFNPDYGVYSDIYQPTEITNRNSAYAATDIEETGATVIRDNNPQYE